MAQRTRSISLVTVLLSVSAVPRRRSLKVVQTWQLNPSTCSGNVNTVPYDLVVRFQGW